MIKVISSSAMTNPYPEQPDDGTWEGEGGYVAKPDHQMYFLRAISMPHGMGQDSDKIVMHPLTFAEYEYWFGRNGSPLTGFIDHVVKSQKW